MRTLSIRLLDFRSDADLLRTLWRDLEGTSDQRPHYHRWAWVRMLAHHRQGRGGDVLVAVGLRQGRAVALLPCERIPHRRFGRWYTRLALLTDPPFMADWVAAPGFGAAEGRQFLVEVARATRASLISLGQIPEESDLWRAVHHPGLGGVVSADAARTVFFLEPGADDQGFLARRSLNFRRNLLRARRRLAATPGVSFETILPGPAFELGLTRFLEIESSGWKGGETGKALAGSAARLADLRRRMDALRELGLVRLHFLKVGALAAAALLAIWDPAAVHAYKIGVAPAFGRLSPGHLMLDWLLGQARAQAIPRIELFGDSAWLESWRPSRHDLRRADWYAPTMTGWLGGVRARLRR